ncbi:MAG: immunity 17 family protein [Mediterranea sp.]|jgi:hypothetical protein|nr:immunity 17 family protein [Mediterranea sp.]
MSHYLIQGIFLLAGLTALLAALGNWNWFFNSRNAAFIVNNVGRPRARLFYGVLGVILIVMAVFFYLQPTASN